VAIQRLCRYALLYTIIAICALPAVVCAEDDTYYSSWEAKYSGKYRLVWYYKTREEYVKNQPSKILAHNKEFLVRPDVRPPGINGIYLLEYSIVNEGEDVLDIGTGTGIHAIFAAEKARHVVATDIYEPAVENAINNATRHGLKDKIDFRVGDLFEPIKADEKFDVFYININFPFSVGDERRKTLHERLFSKIRQYMKPNARIYFQTSFIKNIPDVYEMLTRHGFHIMELRMEYIPEFRHEPVFMMIQSY